MATRQNIINRVRAFTDIIIAEGVILDKVILFGSYTKNQQNDDSDIDVALISPLFNGFGFEDRKYFARINNRKEFIDIETKTYPSDYFNNGDPFITEIMKTGVEIYNIENHK
jgi:uncharacterized protein